MENLIHLTALVPMIQMILALIQLAGLAISSYHTLSDFLEVYNRPPRKEIRPMKFIPIKEEFIS